MGKERRVVGVHRRDVDEQALIIPEERMRGQPQTMAVVALDQPAMNWDHPMILGRPPGCVRVAIASLRRRAISEEDNTAIRIPDLMAALAECFEVGDVTLS